MGKEICLQFDTLLEIVNLFVYYLQFADFLGCPPRTGQHFDIVTVNDGSTLTFICHNCSCSNSLCWEVNGVAITDSQANLDPHYYNFDQIRLNGTGRCINKFTMTTTSDSNSFPYYYILVYCTQHQNSAFRELICTRNVSAYIMLIVVEKELPKPSTMERKSQLIAT